MLQLLFLLNCKLQLECELDIKKEIKTIAELQVKFKEFGNKIPGDSSLTKLYVDKKYASIVTPVVLYGGL